MQAILLAQRAKYFGSHGGVPMVRPVENLRFDQRFGERLGKPFAQRINVFAKIRVMDETFATDFQLGSKLAQVRFHNIPIRMNEGIEAKNEIHRRIGNHRQRATVIENAVNVRMTCKTFPAGFDTVARLIHGPQLVAVILQIMRPASEPRSDFQNRSRRETLANSRKNCAGPLRGRAAPRFRPFLSRLSPVVIHRMEHKFMALKTDIIRIVDDGIMEEIHIAMLKKKAM